MHESQPPPGDDAEEPAPDYNALPASADTAVKHPEGPSSNPRIWVGSWLDYNDGVLHGAWLNATHDESTITAEIAAMLAASPTAARTGQPAEDWGIFDTDDFGELRIDEHDSIEWVAAVGRGIAEYGPAFAAYAEVMEDLDALPGFEDVYLGHYDSTRAYAEQLVDELRYEQMLDDRLPADLRRYVDVNLDRLAHDIEVGGTVHVLPANDGGIWLFRA